ncbi:MAG: glycosyltransferase family 39 protein [Bacteriovorax sp.]|nr:glycosyltransferase family 39 protein [Bacteriovorax sp.]
MMNMSFKKIFFLSFVLRAILYWVGHDSLDIDEAEIITYGRTLWNNRLFQIYLPTGYHWELVASYLFGGLDLVHSSLPRLLSFLFSLLDLLFLYHIAKRFFTERIALVSVFLLATSPWHLYYSNITGTINLCLTFILFFVWLNPKRWWSRVLLHAFGLLIYPAYRIFFVVDGFVLLKKKEWRKIFFNGVSIACSLLLVFLVHHQITFFISRGQHNFIGHFEGIFKNYATFLIAPFSWPLSYYKIVASTFFVGDYTHYGLVRLIHGPPLGWACAFLALIGLGILWRTQRLKSLAPYYMVPFLVLGFMGPSVARMYILLPLFVLLGALAFEGLEKNVKTPKTLFYGFFILALISSIDLLYQRSQLELNDTVFHRRSFLVAQEFRKDEYLTLFKDKPVTILTGPGLNVWRYLVDSQKLRAFIVPSFLFDEYLFADLKANKQDDGTQWFFIPDFSGEIDSINENAQYVSGREKIMDYLNRNANLLERKELFHGQMRLGQMIKIIWTKA